MEMVRQIVGMAHQEIQQTCPIETTLLILPMMMNLRQGCRRQNINSGWKYWHVLTSELVCNDGTA